MTTSGITQQHRPVGGHLARRARIRAFKCRAFRQNQVRTVIYLERGTFHWQGWKVYRLSLRMARQMEARPS